MTTYNEQFLDAIADAIEKARCPGREGPYGLYDYSAYPGSEPPHVIRDFRPGLSGRAIGRTVECFEDAAEARRHYDELTRRYIAKAAVNAMEEWFSKRLQSEMTRRTEIALLGVALCPPDKS